MTERRRLRDGDPVILQEGDSDGNDTEVFFHGFFQHMWTEEDFEGKTTQHAAPRATLELASGKIITAAVGRIRRKIIVKAETEHDAE